LATKQIPVMIVSTSASAEDIKKCFDAGAQDYVTKPINAQEVLSKAAAILRVPQRVHYRLAVTVKVVGATSGRTFTGVSRNISQGGILVECPEALAGGTALKLDLPLKADQSVISFDGEVVRSDPDHLGDQHLAAIKFVNLTPYQELALSEFIARHESQRCN
jgi:DNA-binding response OmpR family regulator